jgi:hypothetical protein
MMDDFLEALERALVAAGATDAADRVEVVRAYLEDESDRGRLDTTLAAMGTPEEVAIKILARPARHHHLDPVRLPDGSTVWAVSYRSDHDARERHPDFGLYLDERWQPPWPHAHVDWPDFGIPADRAAMLEALADVVTRAGAGEVVELGCLGGHGRTGTALACLAVLAGLADDQDPVEWVRSTYCERAVETDEQAAFVRALRP